jgi:hypothetical protein
LEDYRQPWDRFAGRLAEWPLSENIREVADAIYLAATDGAEVLRYPVGKDVIPLLGARLQMDDISFKRMMAEQTGI